MTKKYVVINDRQGGSFGMGRADTALDWLEQMLEWRDMDDNFGDYEVVDDLTNEEYLDTYEGCKAYWEKKIEDGKEQELIDYIGEIWELDFAKCFEYCGKTFAYEIELDCPKDEYPFLATVYQLDDEAMPHAVWDDYYQTAEDADKEVIQTFIESVQEDITKLRKETN